MESNRIRPANRKQYATGQLRSLEFPFESCGPQRSSVFSPLSIITIIVLRFSPKSCERVCTRAHDHAVGRETNHICAIFNSNSCSVSKESQSHNKNLGQQGGFISMAFECPQTATQNPAENVTSDKNKRRQNMESEILLL